MVGLHFLLIRKNRIRCLAINLTIKMIFQVAYSNCFARSQRNVNIISVGFERLYHARENLCTHIFKLLCAGFGIHHRARRSTWRRITLERKAQLCKPIAHRRERAIVIIHFGISRIGRHFGTNACRIVLQRERNMSCSRTKSLRNHTYHWAGCRDRTVGNFQVVALCHHSIVMAHKRVCAVRQLNTRMMIRDEIAASYRSRQLFVGTRQSVSRRV